MHICTVIKDTIQSLQTGRNKHVFKQDMNDVSDVAHLKSFRIEFQTEEEAKENERSPSDALLCAGLWRRGNNPYIRFNSATVQCSGTQLID